jgi:hypothetical protein
MNNAGKTTVKRAPILIHLHTTAPGAKPPKPEMQARRGFVKFLNNLATIDRAFYNPYLKN